MYKIIYIVSWLIRSFLLPNPFENVIGDKACALIFNSVAGEAIISALAFFITGCWYTRKVNKKESGSLGYLISYIAITFLFIILSSTIKDLKICLFIFFIIYIITCIILSRFKTKFVTF